MSSQYMTGEDFIKRDRIARFEIVEGSGSFKKCPTVHNPLIFIEKIALDIGFCICYE